VSGDGFTVLERLGIGLGLQPSGSIYGPARGREGRRLATERAARIAAVAPPPAPPVNLTALLKTEIDVAGRDAYARRCRVLHRDRTAQLLEPGEPFRGHLRLLYDVDPNPGPDGELHRVLLLVPADVTTCHQAVAASFGIHPSAYRPIREV